MGFIAQALEKAGRKDYGKKAQRKARDGTKPPKKIQDGTKPQEKGQAGPGKEGQAELAMRKHLEPNKILRFLVPVSGAWRICRRFGAGTLLRAGQLSGRTPRGVMFANMIIHVHKKRHVHEQQRGPFFMFMNMAVFNRKPRKFYVREHYWPT